MASEFGGLLQIDEAALARAPKEEQEAFAAALAEIKEALDENPLQAYRPHPKQRPYHEATESIRALLGGSRTGKTEAGTADDLVQALPEDWVPKHLLPYKRYGFEREFKGRVITPDLGHTMEAALNKFRKMVPPATLLDGSWEKAFDKTKRILRFDRGDQIDFMSTEQEPNKFGAVDLDRVRFDEEPSGPNSWAIFRDSWFRLLDRSGNMDFTMTPLLGITWVNDEIWEKRTKSHIFAMTMSMRDNPYLPQDEMEQRLSIVTDEERRAVEHGEFVHFEGKFFSEFSSRHVINVPSKEEISVQDIVVGIDPGRETGVVWLAFDRDNKAQVFHERLFKDTLVPDIAAEIKATNRTWGIDPVYVMDPAGRIKRGNERESIMSAFVREEIYAQAGENDRAAGILEMKRRLQAKEPELLVASSCERLIWEFPRYRRDPGSTKDFDAVKKDDHELDALRYALMSRTWVQPEPRTHNRFSNYNSFTPDYEPPYEAPTPQAPPLGSWS